MGDCRQTFSNYYSSYGFCPILMKVGTHDPCASMTVEQIFRNFALKIFGKFLKFYVSSGAL